MAENRGTKNHNFSEITTSGRLAWRCRYMLWNNSFETNFVEIDRQNYVLIARIEAMMYSNSKDERLAQFEIFENIVENYFEREQSIHRMYNFFDSETHRQSHEAYLKMLKEVKQNLAEDGATLESEKFFRKNTFEYLKKHILCHDHLFGFFCQHDNPRKSFLPDTEQLPNFV